MSGRNLKDAMELVCIAAGKDGFRHYDGSGAIWAGRNQKIADATFNDWGLAESTAVILNAIATGKLVSQPKKPIQEFVDAYPGDPEALVDALVLEIERLEAELARMAS